MTALLFAIAHAVPVSVAAMLTNNSKTVLVVAIVMSVTAIAIGSAPYAVLDLAAVWIAFLLAVEAQSSNDPASITSSATRPTPERIAGESSLGKEEKKLSPPAPGKSTARPSSKLTSEARRPQEVPDRRVAERRSPIGHETSPPLRLSASRRSSKVASEAGRSQEVPDRCVAEHASPIVYETSPPPLYLDDEWQVIEGVGGTGPLAFFLWKQAANAATVLQNFLKAPVYMQLEPSEAPGPEWYLLVPANTHIPRELISEVSPGDAFAIVRETSPPPLYVDDEWQVIEGVGGTGPLAFFLWKQAVHAATVLQNFLQSPVYIQLEPSKNLGREWYLLARATSRIPRELVLEVSPDDALEVLEQRDSDHEALHPDEWKYREHDAMCERWHEEEHRGARYFGEQTRWAPRSPEAFVHDEEAFEDRVRLQKELEAIEKARARGRIGVHADEFAEAKTVALELVHGGAANVRICRAENQEGFAVRYITAEEAQEIGDMELAYREAADEE